jgi:hypothetical protein
VIINKYKNKTLFLIKCSSIIILFIFSIYIIYLSNIGPSYNIRALKSSISHNPLSLIKKINLKELRIYISKKNLLELSNIVDDHKTKIILRNRKYFPAKIKIDNEIIKTNIRLKGDYAVHVQFPKKWSFRIKIIGNNTYEGMKVFSIQHPKHRNMLYEWVYIRHLLKEKILTPRSEFIRVFVNDEPWGIYLLEEFFRKELLERQYKRESVIIKYNDENYFDKLEAQLHKSPNIPEYIEEWRIDKFDTSKVIESHFLTEMFSSAINKINGLKKGEYKFEEVYDIYSIAKYWALCDLFLSHHGCSWRSNVRFYYNPITSLLEQIHYDGEPGNELIKSITPALIGMSNTALPEAGNSQLFILEYVKELQRVTSEEYINNIKKSLDDEISNYTNILGIEFEDVNYDWNELYKTARHLRSYLLPINPQDTVSTFTDYNQKNKIYIKNLRSLPVLIAGLQYKKNDSWIDLNLNDSNIESSIDKLGLYLPKNIEFSFIEIELPNDFLANDEIRVRYMLLDNHNIYYASVGKMNFYNRVGAPSVISISKLINTHPYIQYNKDKNTLFIKKITKSVNEDIIIPLGVSLHIEAGTILTFAEEAALISYSPIILTGEKNNPIVLTSKEDSKWPGIIILNTTNKSFINNTRLFNTKGIVRPGWITPAGLTIYKSEVEIKNSIFENSFSEDFINSFDSKLRIYKSEFKNISLDALDIDYGNAEIIDSYFINIGNDAIDTSNSLVNISNVNIISVGDKGISVGEKSSVKIINSTVNDANIGLASKDKSNVYVMNTAFLNIRKGALAAYQKKQEYGPSIINAYNLKFNNNNKNVMLEKDSLIIIDNISQTKFYDFNSTF